MLIFYQIAQKLFSPNDGIPSNMFKIKFENYKINANLMNYLPYSATVACPIFLIASETRDP